MVPIPNKEAKTIANAITNNIILIFGPVKQILSDRGTEFVNSTIQDLCQVLGINQLSSAPYSHATLGAIERTHRVFNEYLRAYLDRQSDWEENMKFFTFCYNTTPHSSLNFNYTPFELVFGRKVNTLTCLNSTHIDPLYNSENYAKEVRFRLQQAQTHAKYLLEQAKERRKIGYDKNSRPLKVEVGDKIIVVDETRHKHEPIYAGPFIITKIMEPNVEILDILNQNKLKIVHKNNIRKYLA
jgi:hypothetical protein